MLDSGSRRSRRSRISGMVSQIGRHRRRDTEFRSARVILFEVLEQRVLLSGDPLSSTALATQPVLYTALTTSTSMRASRRSMFRPRPMPPPSTP